MPSIHVCVSDFRAPFIRNRDANVIVGGGSGGGVGRIIPIEDPDDPRFRQFRLNERGLASRTEKRDDAGAGLFFAEGDLVIERALAAGCVPVAALVDIDDVAAARRRARLPRLRRRDGRAPARHRARVPAPHRRAVRTAGPTDGRPGRPIGRPPRRARSRRQPGQRRLDHPQCGGVRVGRPDPRSHQRRPARPAIAARGDGDRVRPPPRPDTPPRRRTRAPSTASQLLATDARRRRRRRSTSSERPATGGHPDRLRAGRD